MSASGNASHWRSTASVCWPSAAVVSLAPPLAAHCVDHWLAAHLHSAAIGRCTGRSSRRSSTQGVLEEAKHVEHWTIGHVVSVQPFGPVLVRLRGKERRQLCHQCAPVSLSLAQVGISGSSARSGRPTAVQSPNQKR